MVAYVLPHCASLLSLHSIATFVSLHLTQYVHDVSSMISCKETGWKGKRVPYGIREHWVVDSTSISGVRQGPGKDREVPNGRIDSLPFCTKGMGEGEGECRDNGELSKGLYSNDDVLILGRSWRSDRVTPVASCCSGVLVFRHLCVHIGLTVQI